MHTSWLDNHKSCKDSLSLHLHIHRHITNYIWMYNCLPGAPGGPILFPSGAEIYTFYGLCWKYKTRVAIIFYSLKKSESYFRYLQCSIIYKLSQLQFCEHGNQFNSQFCVPAWWRWIYLIQWYRAEHLKIQIQFFGPALHKWISAIQFSKTLANIIFSYWHQPVKSESILFYSMVHDRTVLPIQFAINCTSKNKWINSIQCGKLWANLIFYSQHWSNYTDSIVQNKIKHLSIW